MKILYNTSKITDLLLKWYKVNKRDLPWRKSKDIYSIWLSEVMLQQTQVDTVIPFYSKWLKQYPTIQNVANAKEKDLLKIWEGLGYYNRCRNFHKSAKIIIKHHNGLIPHDYKDLIALPGIGPYIASAVLSIANGIPLPAIDGNIKRVLSRLLRIKQDTPFNIKKIKTHIQKWMENAHPGDINEALMDLGSSICRPNQAHCYVCPLSSFCGAYTSGVPESYPQTVNSKPIPNYSVVTGLIWKNNRFLIMKREEKNHLGGLWEFPGGKTKKNETFETALKREIKEECGLSINVGKKIGKIKHLYSHFSIDMHAFHCTSKNGNKLTTDQPYSWVFPEQVSQYPFPKANHKIFKLLEEQNWND